MNHLSKSLDEQENKSVNQSHLVSLKNSKGESISVSPIKFTDVDASAIRDNSGKTIGENLKPLQNFSGMIYSNSNTLNFYLEGIPVSIDQQSASVFAETMLTKGQLLAMVSDRQFSLPISQARVDWVSEVTGKRLIGFTLIKESIEVD